MPANIAFYVHHHGSGHLMRCVAISRYLEDCNVTFIGSHLSTYRQLIPEQVQCIHLPMDTPVDTDADFGPGEDIAGLHYAPLNIAGQAERVSLMTRFFADTPQLLLVVDVSVEVAMLARLCGVPFVVMRQHGNRLDLPHELAYRNARLLIAPYPALFAQQEPEWLAQKTYYTGGFSRFAPVKGSPVPHPKTVVVLVGTGGTSINLKFIQHLAARCPDWKFTVIGKIDVEGVGNSLAGVNFLGSVPDPLPQLLRCAVIIGNTGHNTVMETALLNKPFITIPEERPFEEQAVKAEVLHELNLAVVVQPNELYTVNWAQLLHH